MENKEVTQRWKVHRTPLKFKATTERKLNEKIIRISNDKQRKNENQLNQISFYEHVSCNQRQINNNQTTTSTNLCVCLCCMWARSHTLLCDWTFCHVMCRDIFLSLAQCVRWEKNRNIYIRRRATQHKKDNEIT